MAEIATCLDAIAAVRARRMSVSGLVEQALERAAKSQERFRSFILLLPEDARKHAAEIDAQLAAGKKLPLAGVVCAVKDLIDVAGAPTTCGSPAFATPAAGADATVVRRLRAAGAVVLGKLSLHECAFGFTGENPHFGDVKNPWDPARIPGGSSSGSAVAVALGICPLTLGSDTGGSIRLPSALCNLSGLKPTYGRVSRAGVAPLSWTMDHVGPMAHTAADLAIALRELAGFDSLDETTSRRAVPDYLAALSEPLRGLRLGLPRAGFFDALEPDVAAAVERAVAALVERGATRVDVALPHLAEVIAAHRAIIFAESASYYQPFLADRAEKFGTAIRPLLAAGLFLPAVDYLKALRARRRIRKEWAEVFATVDCLVTPASPCVATRFGQETVELPGGAKPLVRAYLDLTLPFNFSGHPALSVPCGFSAGGLPIGLQLVGRPFSEGQLLAAAHQYQQATDWHTRRPPAVA